MGIYDLLAAVYFQCEAGHGRLPVRASGVAGVLASGMQQNKQKMQGSLAKVQRICRLSKKIEIDRNLP